MSTLADVARQAGVSISTASRILNGSKSPETYSDECVTRVRAAAAKVRYVAGYHRRAIRERRTETLGMALDIAGPGEALSAKSALGAPYLQQLTVGVEMATHFVGYNLQLIVPSGDRRAMARGLEQLRQHRIDGLVVPHVSEGLEAARLLAEPLAWPIAVVQPPAVTDWPSIHFDHDRGMAMLVEHLASLGHRRLLWLGPEMMVANNKAGGREATLYRQAAQAGLRCDACRLRRGESGDLSTMPAEVDRRLPPLLAAGLDATAVVCASDIVAIGAARTLRRHGLRVPADVSLVGFDNIPCELMDLQLTTIDHRLADMSHRATEIVLEMARPDSPPPRSYAGLRETVEPILVVRESTGPA